MEISPTSKISWHHSPCVLLLSKIEPWVLQHTHSESLRTMSACWIWNEALRGALSKHGQKWPATHFRPQFCDSDLNEIWHAARAGQVHSQLCYSLFWSNPHRASYGAEKSKLREKCDTFQQYHLRHCAIWPILWLIVKAQAFLFPSMCNNLGCVPKT